MQDSRRSTGFFLSMALHALLVGLAVLNLGSTMKLDMDKPMYTVDLVSLNPSEDPAAGETGEAAGGPPTLAEGQPSEQAASQAAPIPPPPAKAEKAKPEPVRDDAKAISAKKVEEKKRPEKKEEKKEEKAPPKPEEKKLSREELLKQALQDVKQDVSTKAKDAKATAKAPEPKKDPVAGELAALRKSTGGNIFTAGGTGPGGAGGGSGTGAGGSGSGLMSVYGDIVKQIIKKNWRFPAFGTETNVAVQLEIRIDPQGKILGARVLKPSGNTIFDNSALSAVEQTQTLPPPRVKSLDTLRITFNLQEMLK